MSSESGRREMAKRERSGERTEVGRRERVAGGKRGVGGSGRKKQRKISLDSLRRLGRCLDRCGSLVAQLQTSRADDVFFRSVSVSGARYRSGPERTNHRCSRLPGIRAEKCALDLRAGIAGRKNPGRYRG